MDRLKYLKKNGFKGASKWTAADQIRVCRLHLWARDLECDTGFSKITGSRFVDRDAKELNIKIDWRG